MAKILPQMTDELKSALEDVLSDTYALALKYQNYHWNVCGMNFRDLHLLFGEHYTDLFTAIDEVAEQIRSIGFKVPATFSYLKQKTTIPDPNAEFPTVDKIADLILSQELLYKTLQKAIKKARDCDDVGTEDLLIKRVGIHQKQAWFLRSLGSNC